MRLGVDSGICTVAATYSLEFKRGEGSIPFTRYTSPSFILNGLSLRRSFEASDSHNGFNEPHLRYDAPTLCSDLCDSAIIDGSAVAASVKTVLLLFFVLRNLCLLLINGDHPKEIAISN